MSKTATAQIAATLTGDSLDRRAALADAAKATQRATKALAKAVAQPAAQAAPAANDAKAPKAAKAPSATARLWALADDLADEHGPALTVGMFREAAVAAGLNRTSAGIAFYRWQAARTAGVEGCPRGSSKGATASA
jgi:hypothetical protein